MGRFTFHNFYNEQFVTQFKEQEGGRISHDRRQMLRDFESDGKNPFTLPCFQITNIFMNDFFRQFTITLNENIDMFLKTNLVHTYCIKFLAQFCKTMF